MQCLTKNCTNTDDEGQGRIIIIEEDPPLEYRTWICNPCLTFLVAGRRNNSQASKNIPYLEEASMIGIAHFMHISEKDFAEIFEVHEEGLGVHMLHALNDRFNKNFFEMYKWKLDLANGRRLVDEINKYIAIEAELRRTEQ